MISPARVSACSGGDHTITLPILRAIATDGPVGCVHFDAHADTLDTLVGSKINHGTPCSADSSYHPDVSFSKERLQTY